jgi:hypothetical protein
MSSRVALRGTNGTDIAKAPVSAARREHVDRAWQCWIRKLIDLSRRNNLLYDRPPKTGALDLPSAESSGIATLLSGVEPVSIEKLLPNGKDESVTKVVRDIARRARRMLKKKVYEHCSWLSDYGYRIHVFAHYGVGCLVK